MRLEIVAVGKFKKGPEKDLLTGYLSQAAALGGRVGLRSITVREISESRAGSAAARREEEGRHLLAALKANAFLIAVDGRGTEMTSEKLASQVRRQLEVGTKDLAFLLGGPDGHLAEICDQSSLVLSLGRMTWPHRLARVMLAEQIYRSVTILINHPYHRA